MSNQFHQTQFPPTKSKSTRSTCNQFEVWAKKAQSREEIENVPFPPPCHVVHVNFIYQLAA